MGDPRHVQGPQISVHLSKTTQRNELAGPVDISNGWRFLRCLTVCEKQHRQHDSAGQVDLPTRVEVRVMGDPRQM